MCAAEAHTVEAGDDDLLVVLVGPHEDVLDVAEESEALVPEPHQQLDLRRGARAPVWSSGADTA